MYFVPFSAPATAGKDRTHGRARYGNRVLGSFLPMAGWIPALAANQVQTLGLEHTTISSNGYRRDVLAVFTFEEQQLYI